MYEYNSTYSEEAKLKHMEENTTGYIRVFNTSPDVQSISVLANDLLIANNITYGIYTGYMALPLGTYNISLYINGDDSQPIVINQLTIYKDPPMTLAVVGASNNIGFLLISDDDVPINPDYSMFRFAFMSPDAPAMDITLLDGTILSSSNTFKQITEYIEGNHRIQIRESETSQILFTVPCIAYEPNIFYSFYIIGFVDQRPYLSALLVEDKKSSNIE